MSSEVDLEKTEPVTVVCGANEQQLDVAGSTVADLTSQLEDVMNIPSPHQTIVGGQTVNDEYVLQSGDRLEIVKPAGSKG
jgi:sulfur carrier protein ThiS